MFTLSSIPALLADSFWMPQGVSTVSGDLDWFFYFIFYICVFFFFLILGLLVVFSWKYRYRPGHEQGSAPKHSTALELTWTFIPTVIVIVIFYYGFKQYLNLAVPPPNPYEIIVNARTWSYSFEYSNGYETADAILHIPSNTPVQMILTSSDVIHGFYVPQFRVKKDIVPGRYNKLWFQCDVPGTYDLFCTQYCGQGHSQMRGYVVVDSPADFKAWLEKATAIANNAPPPVMGKRLYAGKGCAQCHSIDGTKIIGPTWKNLYGTQVSFEDGTSTKVDETFLRTCILTPAAHIVKGYPNVMPPQQGLLTDKDIFNLIAFIKTLSDNYKPEPTTQPATAPSADVKPAVH